MLGYCSVTLPTAQPAQVMPLWADVVGLALRGQVNVPTCWLYSWLFLLWVKVTSPKKCKWGLKEH